MYTTYWSVMASASCFFQTRNISELKEALDTTVEQDTAGTHVLSAHGKAGPSGATFAPHTGA